MRYIIKIQRKYCSGNSVPLCQKGVLLPHISHVKLSELQVDFVPHISVYVNKLSLYSYLNKRLFDVMSKNDNFGSIINLDPAYLIQRFQLSVGISAKLSEHIIY